MGTITMYQTVFEAHAMMGWSGWQTTWVKTIETPFLPREGDSVYFLRSAGDLHEWGISNRVKRAYMDGNGRWAIELINYQLVDPEKPNPQMEPHIDGEFRRAWYVEDGDLSERLRDSGWELYS